METIWLIWDILKEFEIFLKPLGGAFKFVEFGIVLLTLFGTFFVANRVKRVAKELDKSVDKAVQKLETRMQAMKAEVAEVADTQSDQFVTTSEVPSSQPLVENALDRWHLVRHNWTTARSLVEERVQSIEDRRMLRKYANHDWRNYSGLLDLLVKDGYLTENGKAVLKDMQTRFNALKSRKANVTAKDVSDFEQLSQTLLKELAQPIKPRQPSLFGNLLETAAARSSA